MLPLKYPSKWYVLYVSLLCIVYASFPAFQFCNALNGGFFRVIWNFWGLFLGYQIAKLPIYDHSYAPSQEDGCSKNREKQLLEDLEKIKQLNQAKSVFVSMISHEFRTPMASIQAASELLKDHWDQLALSERGAYLEQIRSNIFYLSQMMDDVLLLGKIQNGQLQLRTILTDPIALCHKVIKFIQIYGKKPRVTIVVTKNFPHLYPLDPSLFQQILSNLLSNALKYSPQNEKVTLALHYIENTFVFEVKDKGIGIPEEDQAKIFHLFHRGSNVGSITGIGIGMFMVKYCVDLSRGTITLKSGQGLGTTFRVAFPSQETLASFADDSQDIALS